MIADFNQPAKSWISDLMRNMHNLLEYGDDPSVKIIIDGIEFEFRLNNLPGVFTRETIAINHSESSNA